MEKVMKAELNEKDFDEFLKKTEKLEEKGYSLGYEVTKTKEGMFLVEIIGEHDINELDTLTECS